MDGSYAALSNTFLVFAIGFFARPLGSIIFGAIGDRKGRKLGLVWSILWMTLPTTLMGVLPTYYQIGIAAAVILTCLRIVQGIPVGGEIGGIMCYLTEAAPSGQKIYFGSWAVFGSQIGFIISSLEIYAFEKLMDPTAFHTWGWRLSFFIGGLLGVIGWWLRKRLHETPPFEKVIHSHHVLKRPIVTIFKDYKKQVVQTFLLSCITSGAFYVVYFFSVIYLTDIIKMDFFEALLINACLLTFSTIFLPIFGKLGNHYGIKKLIISSSLAVIVIPYFMFYFANQREIVLTVFFELLLTLFLSLNYALLPALITGLFPTPVRYTGVGIAYNCSNAVFGGLSPFLCLYLIKQTGSNLAPAFYFSFLGVISLLPFLLFKDRALHDA
jgi:MHS family proline/betaine transporter-like MFS transporter